MWGTRPAKTAYSPGTPSSGGSRPLPSAPRVAAGTPPRATVGTAEPSKGSPGKVGLRVWGAFSPLFAGTQLRLGSARAPVGAIRPTAAAGPSLRDFALRVGELREALGDLRLDGRLARAGATARSARASSVSLGLSTLDTSTTLRSVEEVNAVPTSFSPSAPSFAGGSNSSPSVGGTYSGENGDTTLTFTATLGGIVGVTPIRFAVRDGEGTLVETLDLGFQSPGTTFTLQNGLELSFSSGSVQLGDSFEVDVSATVGSAVRPDLPFDGVGDQGAGFEPGLTVGSGSFEVNGVSIVVSASDTLNDVLARIGASGADVDASFDTAAERVVLTNRTAGPAGIVLVNDTSGLLAATKLVGATAVLGSLDERSQPIAEVASLAAVRSGTFAVNGVVLSVDVLQDSLADLVERIESSGTGARASLEATSGKLVVRGSKGSPLVLDDGTSGLFTALGIEVGTYEARRARAGARFRDEGALRLGLARLATAYTALSAGAVTGFGAAAAGGLRTRLDALVGKAFQDLRGASGQGTLRSGLGLDLVAAGGAQRALVLDPTRLSRVLDRDPDALTAFLYGDDRQDDGTGGLLGALSGRLEAEAGALARLLGREAVGLGLDLRA